MKKSHVYFVLVMLLAALLSSCASTYYQVYETRPLPGTQVERGDGVLVYEDENCRVLYDFWTDGGNAGFAIYNKTGENLYVDKSESFFVKNGTAKNYYEGKSYARTVNEVVPPPREAVEAAATVDAVVNSLSLLTAAVAVGAGAQVDGIYQQQTVVKGSSNPLTIQWDEEKVVAIPPHTSKYIKYQTINELRLRYCDFPQNPRGNKDVQPLPFTEEESPIVFENIIAYKVGKEGSQVNIRNGFYVSMIANYPESLVVGTAYEEWCGKKTMNQYRYFKRVDPAGFYVKYSY